MAIDLARTAVSDYDVTWKGVALGAVDKVSVKLELATKDIKVGSLGDVVLGKRTLGVIGTIEVEVREIDHTMYEDLTPWNNGSTTASLLLSPPTRPADLYDWAGLLTLHPTNMGTNTSRDLNLLKAVCTHWYPGERNGVDDDVNIVVFEIFPDRGASLTNLVYGYIGPTV